MPPAATTLAAYARASMHCHMMGLVHDGDGPDPLRRQLPAAGVSGEELDAALCRCVDLAKVLAPFYRPFSSNQANSHSHLSMQKGRRRGDWRIQEGGKGEHNTRVSYCGIFEC